MNDKSAPSSSVKPNHAWRFFRAGGVDQVLIRSGADISSIPNLDLKLWFALAMPTTGVDIDPATLALIDSDRDGRIRPPEIIQAIHWAETAFANLDDLVKGGDSVAIAAIKSESIRRSAKHILAALGKPDHESVSLAEVSRMEEVFARTRLNGDGIVPPESAEDAPLAKAIADIVATVGSAQDRSGRPGVNLDRLNEFYAQAESYCKWCDIPNATPAILPYGLDTFDAAAATDAIRAKADDYFVRVKLAAYDPRCAETLNRPLVEYAGLSAKTISPLSAETKEFPIAYIGGECVLPLEKGVNPAWASAVQEFREKAARLVLGAENPASLTEAEWDKIKAALAPFEKWQAAKPATAVEKLGETRLRELMDRDFRVRIAALIADDLALKPEFEETSSVEKLVRFQRDLVRILSNFVNFSEFYQKRSSVFISGNLYLDARNCHLCVDVADASSHATLAGLAGMYLAYCDVRRPGGQTKTIVAAFTDGDSDNLMVGRNGVFFDRRGNDWDATITKIITNPISIREAFWSPYKKLQRFLDEFIAKRAAGSDAAANDKLTGSAEWAASEEKRAAVAPPVKKIDVGTVAALGVAVGAIGATLSALATGLMGLHWWQLPFVFAGIIFLISTPSMVMAWLKLKRRNIAPVLDANGWAINTHARINTPFGAAMTDSAKIPAHIAGRLIDPFAEKKSYWQVYVAIAAVIIATFWVLNRLGKIYLWTDGLLGSAPRVMVLPQTDAAPADAAPAEPVNPPDSAPQTGAK
jgi:hypothetical protein